MPLQFITTGAVAVTLSNGNKTATSTAASGFGAGAYLNEVVAGKCCFAMRFDGLADGGNIVELIAATTGLDFANYSIVGTYISEFTNASLANSNGSPSGATLSGAAPIVNSDVIFVCIDEPNNLIWVYKNGTIVSGAGNPAAGTGGLSGFLISGARTPAAALSSAGAAMTVIDDPVAAGITVPSGFTYLGAAASNYMDATESGSDTFSASGSVDDGVMNAVETGSDTFSASGELSSYPFPTSKSRASGRTTISNTTSHSITMPAGVVPGDIIVVSFAVDGAPTVSINTGVSGSNWNLLGQASNSTVVTNAIAWKVAEGGDVLTLTTSAAEQSSHISTRWQDASSVTGSSANGSSTNSNPPSHTPGGGSLNYAWMATRAGDSTVVATVAPANFNNLTTLAAAGTNGASSNTAERLFNGSVLDPGTFTSGNEQWASWTLAIWPKARSTGALDASESGSDTFDATGTAGSGSPGLVTFRSLTSTTYASRTNTVLTAPAGLADDDILIAAIFVGANPSAPAVTPPAGFTLLGTATSVTDPSSFNGKLQIYWKRAASESGSYTFTHSSANSQGVLHAYSGCATSGSPVDASSSNSGNNNTTTATGVTTTAANDMLVLLAHDWTASGNVTPASGFTKRFDSLIQTSDAIQASAGASGNKTFTNGNPTSTAYMWAAWLVALKADPGGSGATGTLSATEAGSDTAALSGQIIVQGTLSVSESGSDTISSTGKVVVSGTLSVSETGSDTASGTGSLLVQGTLSVAESGSDTAALSGAVPISGAIAATEPSSDTAYMPGGVLIAGAMAASEAGSDVAAFAGGVVAQGDLTASEIGSDTFSGSGGSIASGDLDADEAGSDTAAASGAVLIKGAASASEGGPDALAATGSILIKGDLVVSEVGSDTAAAIGQLIIQGVAAALESGSDALAATGSIQIVGTISAQESGSDTFSGSGSNSVGGNLDAQETGADTAVSSGKVLVSGSGNALEAGSDAAAITGKVLVSGVLSITEDGTDILSSDGGVLVRGIFSVSENGPDGFSATGYIETKGEMAAVEGYGPDTFEATAFISTSGNANLVEGGEDTFEATGVLGGQIIFPPPRVITIRGRIRPKVILMGNTRSKVVLRGVVRSKFRHQD